MIVSIEDYSHDVGTCYRCHNNIEPRISDQWFVAMKKLADKLEEKLHKNSTTFIVNYMDAQVIKHFHQHIIPGYKQDIKLTQDEVYKLMMED